MCNEGGSRGCLEDVRTREKILWDWRATGVEGGQCRIRVMDRLPHPTDRIDETLIRVEWPDPTRKCQPVAHPDKLTTYTIVAVYGKGKIHQCGCFRINLNSSTPAHIYLQIRFMIGL